MVQDFRRNLREEWTENGSPGEFDSWVRDKPQWKQNEGAGEYSQLLACLRLTRAGREDEIQRYMDQGTPSWGYYWLAQMLSTPIFSTVITTNFDDLIYDACSWYSSRRPRVYSVGDKRGVPRPRPDRPTILKLHGDYVYRKTSSTGNEMQLDYEDPTMSAAMTRELSDHDLVVIGYGGGNEPINRFLKQVPDSHAVYWCTYRDDAPDKKLKEQFEKPNWYLVETEGFDHFMDDLYYKLSPSILDTIHLSENEIRDILDLIEEAASPHRDFYAERFLETVGNVDYMKEFAERVRR